MASTASFYDAIYTRNPHKWTNIDRNYTAFKMVSALAKPGKMLDFGCGNGHTLAFFHSQWPDTEYTGVDISEVALDIASKRLPDAEFFTAIPPGGWDVITIMGVAEHFEKPTDELRYIGTFLNPGGFIYLEVPNCLSYSNDKSEGFRKTYAGSDQEEWHLQRDSWEQIIKDAGLVPVISHTGPQKTWEFIWALRVPA